MPLGKFQRGIERWPLIRPRTSFLRLFQGQSHFLKWEPLFLILDSKGARNFTYGCVEQGIQLWPSIGPWTRPSRLFEGQLFFKWEPLFLTPAIDRAGNFTFRYVLRSQKKVDLECYSKVIYPQQGIEIPLNIFSIGKVFIFVVFNEEFGSHLQLDLQLDLHLFF